MKRLSTVARHRRGRLLVMGAFALMPAVGAASAQPAAPPHVITVAAMSYGPSPSDLRVGETVLFVNRDSLPHTVTARDHSFDLRLPPGRSASLVLKKAGAIPFYCIYHTAMRGTLNVAAK